MSTPLTRSYKAPSLIPNNSTRRAVSTVAQSCCLTPKTRVQPLKIRCCPVCKQRYTLCLFYFRLLAVFFDFWQTQPSDSIPTSLSVFPDPESMHESSRWNFVANMYTSSDIRYVLCTSCWRPVSLIYDIPRLWTVFPLVFPRCLTLKTWLSRWHFVAIMYIMWNTSSYIISAAILDFWLPVSSSSPTDSTIEKFDPENMGIAVGILFLASL